MSNEANWPNTKVEEVTPAVLDVTVVGRGGIRLHWAGWQQCTLERMENGEWVKLPLVQDVIIRLSVDDPTPRITLRSLVLPESNLCAPSSPGPDLCTPFSSSI